MVDERRKLLQPGVEIFAFGIQANNYVQLVAEFLQEEVEQSCVTSVSLIKKKKIGRCI